MPYVYEGVRKVWKDDPVDEPTPGPKPYRNTKGDFKEDNDGRPPVDPAIRWKKKYIVDKKTGCLKWKGALNKYGRGTFFNGISVFDAQKYAWKMAYKREPVGKIRTTCSTLCCVNPEHMYEVQPPRKRREKAMFTAQDVLDIRRRYDAGETVTVISKDYPASEKSVSLVARRKSYTWVEEE